MKRTVLFILVIAVVFSVTCFASGKNEAAVKETRPIAIWGTPAWAGDYSTAALAKANEWAQAKFGATFTITSGIAQGSDVIQSLNLLIAGGGSFPDIIVGPGFNDAGKKLYIELAEQGNLLDLTKYTQDPKNYPVLSSANKDYLKAYYYKGKLMAWPQYGWRVSADDPSWVETEWVARVDILEDILGTDPKNDPKNSTELLAYLRQVKAKSAQYKDINGNDIIPFAIYPFTGSTMGGAAGSGGSYESFLDQMMGGGWQVDKSMNLGPKWATVETYNGIKLLNQMYKEGLLDSNQFTIKTDKFTVQVKEGRYALAFGPQFLSVQCYSDINSRLQTVTKDDPTVKQLLKQQTVNILPPIKEANGKLGKVVDVLAGFTFVSAACPNPDAAMKLLDFMLSDEGLVSYMAQGGQLGIDWEWAEAPMYWKYKSYTGTDVFEAHKTPDPSPNPWYFDAKQAEENPPPMLPVMIYITSPAYSSYYQWIFNQPLQFKGIVRGGFAEDNGRTMWNTSEYWAKQKNDLVSAIPSYMLPIYELDPLENSAIATAGERMASAFGELVTAADFDAAYNKYISNMISITNWKPVWTKYKKQWQDWMKVNGDDTAKLKTIEFRSEFKSVMGW